MGRAIPSSSRGATTVPPIPLLAAGIAASIAILFTLCMSHHRSKSSTPRSSSSSPASCSSSINNSSSSGSNSNNSKNSLTKPKLTTAPPDQSIKKNLPAANKEKAAAAALLMSAAPPAAAERRRLLVSLSMRLPEGLSRIGASRREKSRRQGSMGGSSSRRLTAAVSEGGAVEAEADAESVWMKRIILGEKCRVEEEEEEEMVVYDIKGNRQRNYHPRTPRSLPVSRTNSFAGAEAKTAAAGAT